jgi:WD40 repeat protein
MLAELKGHESWFRAAGFVPGGKYLYTVADKIRIWHATNTQLHASFAGKFPEGAEYSFSPDGCKMICYTYDSVFLWQLADQQKLAAIYFKDINTASFSPDGKYFIAADKSGMVYIYSTANHSLVSSFKVSEKGLHDVRYSADGKMLLITSYDQKIELWNTEGKLLYVLAVYKNARGIAGFSKDGKYVIGTEQNYSGIASTQIWSTDNGVLLATLKGQSNNYKVSGNNISPMGDLVVMPQRQGYQSTIYSLPTATKMMELKGHSNYVNYTSFSNDGKYIVTTSDDNTAKIFKVADGFLHADLKGRTRGEISETVFSAGGRYMVTRANGTSFVWNVKEGTLVSAFHAGNDQLDQVKFSPDGKYLLTISANNEVKIWDAIRQTLMVNNLKKNIPNVYVNYQGSFEFTADSKKILIANHDMASYVFECATGNLVNTFNHNWYIDQAAISSNGKYVATMGKDTLKIWNAITGTVINQLLLDAGPGPGLIAFSNSGEQLLVLYNDHAQLYNFKDKRPYKTINASNYLYVDAGKSKLICVSGESIQLLDIEKAKVEFEWKDADNEIYNGTVAFHCLLQNNYLVYKCRYSVKVIDIKLKKQVAEFKTVDGAPNAVNFNGDETQLAIAYSNGTTRIGRLGDPALIKELKQHRAAVNNVYFLPGDKKVLTNSADNTARVWDLQNAKELYTFFALNNKDYLIQEPAGYYTCTPDAAKLLYYVTPDLKVITFDQLDTKYNRPDKLMEAVGNGDTLLIRSYRKAYEKRVKKLGIDTTTFKNDYSVPEADFVNRDNIEFEQKNEKLQLAIKGVDSMYKLDRFNVWVNEVPVFGQRGVSNRKRNLNNFDTTITIKLSNGENRIETSVTNVNGTESYRMPLTVNYSPDVKQKEVTHFIGIGIDRFTDGKYNLQYSAKDIRDLALKLKEKYGNDILIDTLFNENVTVKNVKALKKNLEQTTENDKVIIAYSGHGLLNKEYDYYLSTYPVDFAKPEKDGLPYAELENLLDSIPARKKLMLIDACHSGEVDKEEGIAMNKKADSMGLAKGVIIPGVKQQQVGLKNSFELMQSLFVNVGKSTGATIISAAAGNQFALERGDLKNGVFTFTILEAMQNHPTIKISELKKIVGERVEQLTNGMQKPTSRNETIAVDWDVW